MRTSSLERRGRALEELFIRREEQKLLQDLREQAAVRAQRDALADALGIRDADILAKLLGHGVHGATVMALALIPLIAVAWADGSLDDGEREVILSAAADRGIGEKSAAYQVLGGWLAEPPHDDLFKVWKEYVRALLPCLRPSAGKALESYVLGWSRDIAESVGESFGLGRKVSPAEEKILCAVQAAFRT